MTEIKTHDAQLFFPADQFENTDESLLAICKAATRFGAYSLINRIARRLHGEKRASDAIVRDAIAKAGAEMKRVGAIPAKGARL